MARKRSRTQSGDSDETEEEAVLSDLVEFVRDEGGGLDGMHADPVFKERLREEIWSLLRRCVRSDSDPEHPSSVKRKSR